MYDDTLEQILSSSGITTASDVFFGNHQYVLQFETPPMSTTNFSTTLNTQTMPTFTLALPSSSSTSQQVFSSQPQAAKCVNSNDIQAPGASNLVESEPPKRKRTNKDDREKRKVLIAKMYGIQDDGNCVSELTKRPMAENVFGGTFLNNSIVKLLARSFPTKEHQICEEVIYRNLAQILDVFGNLLNHRYKYQNLKNADDITKALFDLTTKIAKEIKKMENEN
jgi:hypothetical protein